MNRPETKLRAALSETGTKAEADHPAQDSGTVHPHAVMATSARHAGLTATKIRAPWIHARRMRLAAHSAIAHRLVVSVTGLLRAGTMTTGHSASSAAVVATGHSALKAVLSVTDQQAAGSVTDPHHAGTAMTGQRANSTAMVATGRRALKAVLSVTGQRVVALEVALRETVPQETVLRKTVLRETVLPAGMAAIARRAAMTNRLAADARAAGSSRAGVAAEPEGALRVNPVVADLADDPVAAAVVSNHAAHAEP
jgi:hypothetical protein